MVGGLAWLALNCVPAVRPDTRALCFLIQINTWALANAHLCAMTRYDWTHTLVLAATLTLTTCALYILLFAM